MMSSVSRARVSLMSLLGSVDENTVVGYSFNDDSPEKLEPDAGNETDGILRKRREHENNDDDIDVNKSSTVSFCGSASIEQSQGSTRSNFKTPNAVVPRESDDISNYEKDFHEDAAGEAPEPFRQPHGPSDEGAGHGR